VQFLESLTSPKRNSFWGTSVCDLFSYDQTHGRATGRPGVAEATKDAIRGLLGAGQSERAIVQQLGISKGAVGRVRAAMAAAASPCRLTALSSKEGELARSITTCTPANWREAARTPLTGGGRDHSGPVTPHPGG
jgi:hypothetical protein